MSTASNQHSIAWCFHFHYHQDFGDFQSNMKKTVLQSKEIKKARKEIRNHLSVVGDGSKNTKLGVNSISNPL